MAKHSKYILISSALLAGVFISTPASATCSSDPALGSICVTGYNFCPRGYFDADGRLLQIQSHTALFSLFGTIYGGDGRTTFALPDLRSRVPVGAGRGPGLEPIQQGQRGGREQINIAASQMGPHHHSVKRYGTNDRGDSDKAAGAVPARLARANIYSASTAASGVMGPSAVSQVTMGGGEPVDVRDPYLGLRYCVAWVGTYPSRN